MANESSTEKGVNKVELIAREDVASDPDDCTDDSADDWGGTQGDELANEEALARINELTARLDHGPLIKTACYLQKMCRFLAVLPIFFLA
jgi:hypothetical protein